MDLPKYKSHKVVSAARIQGVELRQDDFGHVLDLGEHGEVNVSDQWVNEKHAVAGGYYVVYDDGYTSFSPFDAFIQGYMLEGSTFEQPKITGYRQLSETEVALMNEGKALAEQCGAFIAKLRDHPGSHGLPPGAVVVDGMPPLDQRWVSLGATQLQQGFMAVIRGIAQPTTF